MTEVVAPPTDRIHTLTIERAYQALDVTARGLSAASVADRQKRWGPNTLPSVRRYHGLQRLAAQFTDMFAVVLLVSAGVTFLAYSLQDPRDPGTIRLGFAILGVVVLNAVIGFSQEYAAERTIDALQGMVPHLCRVIRDGERSQVPAAAVVPGDVVVLEAGDAVPADRSSSGTCTPREGHSLSSRQRTRRTVRPSRSLRPRSWSRRSSSGWRCAPTERASSESVSCRTFDTSLHRQ